MVSTGYGVSPITPGFPQRVSASPSPEVQNLVTIDEQFGNGALVVPGQRVNVHYTGRLLSNGEVFDTSEGREPFQFTLGAGEVIEGWDRGLLGMREGGKRKLFIPAAMAYGSKGAPPKIKPGAALVFEVELLPSQSVEGLRQQ